ncbi:MULTISPECIES: efflux transporter outer membrane subunit [unclassified Sphingomonas]|jgi:NodT family efflux transporter outer membrane factor (OMF) lipoprotein|uniref:efflux transporter outer membrane subunit n=1 Tax=Sphingomonadaceae TaxID=41297 RepID=UPI00215076EA|nr:MULTISPECIES: efflux transporter outer membrane subunit [unclassified Sphingomonas]MCR5870060.1 efflux transporter outer membrane subunit [Sphingomonas sp. J344]UUX98247.1 efflux transporter outer membrane subunit [Sphingomonas sp. J315]
MSKFRFLILSPLLLAGCVVGPDYAGPPELGRATPKATFARQAPGAVPNEPAVATWWTTLQDPVLDELERRVLAANPSLEAAQARIRQTRASVRQERGNLFPTAGAQGTAVFADLPGIDLQSGQGGTPTPTPTPAPAPAPSAQDQDTSLRFYNLGLNANWEIDLAGGQVRTIEAANALAAAAAYNAADAQVQLTAEVAQTYTNLRDRQQRAAALHRALELQQQQLELAQQRFRRGTVPAFTVGQADRAVQATSSDLAAAEAEIEIYLNALAALAGEAPGSLDPLLAPPRDIPLPPDSVAIGDPVSLLRRRPDIRAAERNLAAATARIGVAEAARFPKISFMGILGIGGTTIGDLVDLGNISKIAVPQLQWGLLDFGRTSAAIAQTRAGRDEAEAQYRQVVLGALQDAETSLSRFAQQRRTVAALAEISRSAEQSAALMRQRYERGVISLGDSLDAERQRLLAEANLRSAVAALTASYVAVQKSLGLGWSEASGAT